MKPVESIQLAILPSLLQQYQAQKVLIFTSPRTFALYGELLTSTLCCPYDICDRIEPNTKYHQVQEAIACFYPQDYQLIIALGGGSVIDFAKLYKNLTQTTLPLVAIPTTAGTGSEATQFAVYYQNGEKQGLDDPAVLPDYAIVDARFLLESPSYLKACSGIDAYCQAIESYWAVQSTDESKEAARRSILLAKDWLVAFVTESRLDACDAMAQASNLAGQAINISRTTAAHALSYKITTDYGLPHGHAVALSMPDLYEANQQTDESHCQDPRGSAYVRATLAELSELLGVADFRSYWHELMTSIGLSYDFEQLGITDKEALIRDVDQNRLKNNPKNLASDLASFWQ